MAWGRKKRVRLDGIVVHAPSPWNTGSRRERITLVVRPPGGVALSVEAKLKITKETWPVRGMTIPVQVDLDDPRSAEIDADDIAPLEQRVAAGDPTLVDPIAAVRAARVAMEDAEDAATAAHDPALAARTRDMRTKMRAVQEPELDERYRRVEEAYLAGPPTAPDGRLRGYARLVSRTFPRPDGDPDTSSLSWFTDAIYSVQPIGRAPYATVKRYKRRDRRHADERYDVEGAGTVPVLISPGDPHDVEILWDQVPDHAVALFEDMMGAVDRAQAQIAPVVEGMYDQVFAAIPDPAMRATLAQQVQAQGWALPAHLADGGAGPPDTAARLAKLAALRDSGVLTQAEYDDQVARLGDR